MTWRAGPAEPSPDEDPASSADTEVVEKPAKEETVVENATPDYAAGLVSTQVGPAPPPASLAGRTAPRACALVF